MNLRMSEVPAIIPIGRRVFLGSRPLVYELSFIGGNRPIDLVLEELLLVGIRTFIIAVRSDLRNFQRVVRHIRRMLSCYGDGDFSVQVYEAASEDCLDQMIIGAARAIDADFWFLVDPLMPLKKGIQYFESPLSRIAESYSLENCSYPYVGALESGAWFDFFDLPAFRLINSDGYQLVFDRDDSLSRLHFFSGRALFSRSYLEMIGPDFASVRFSGALFPYEAIFSSSNGRLNLVVTKDCVSSISFFLNSVEMEENEYDQSA